MFFLLKLKTERLILFVQAPDIYKEEARREDGSRTEQNT